MEAWDVYDRQGNRTGKIKTRYDVFEDGEYHLGASLWIVNKKGELLIQKRSPTKRINPGKWSITGGAVCAGESSEQACVREVAEEIGLILNIVEIELLSRSFGQDIILTTILLFAILLCPTLFYKSRKSVKSNGQALKISRIFFTRAYSCLTT